MMRLAETARLASDNDIAHAIDSFAHALGKHYGSRLKGIYMFGSRARADHHPESDVDIAVIISGDRLEFWNERRRLTDLAFVAQTGTNAYLQAWPVSEAEWRNPHLHDNPQLVMAMRRDGKPLADKA